MATKARRPRRRTAASASRYEEGAVITTPIVLTRNRGKKRRRKARYTRGTKGLQRFTLGLADAAYHFANSFAKGWDTYVDRSKRSRRRKRDGMVRDLFRNASRGLSDGFDEMGKAPRDLGRRIPTRAFTRNFRLVFPFGT